MEAKKRSGVLILDQIKFDYTFKKKVIKNNNTSGKITVPKGLIGKEVYIVVAAD